MRGILKQLIQVTLVTILAVGSFSSAPATEKESASAAQIEQLVRQLNNDHVEQRDAAEQRLQSLAPRDARQCDAYLALLPPVIDGMPEEVRLRLTRLRRQIETEQANRALAASRMSLSANAMPLAEVLEKVFAETGNRLVDYRDRFGQNVDPRSVTIDIADRPFWPALDKILDAAAMSPYPFSGEESLAVVDREEHAGLRVGSASYSGPFRIEAINVVARRGLRSPDEQGVSVELEIAWEPRLRPIALSQPAADLEVTADDGSKVLLANPESSLDVEVQPGNHATELTIPLKLPARSVSSLSVFKGKLSALVPGRVVEFRFDQLQNAKNIEQSRGGVRVVVDRVRRNQQLWEIHMRLRVESAEAGMESHRGWVFQNVTYLLDKNGEVIDHAGFETTMQTKNEIGLAYFFEVSNDDLSDYTWIYKTPAAIVRLPVEYELKNIPLP